MFKVDNNDNITPCDDNDAKPMTMTIQAVQRQVNAILFGYITATSLKEFTNQQTNHSMIDSYFFLRILTISYLYYPFLQLSTQRPMTMILICFIHGIKAIIHVL